jgi:hypothetical protein
MVKTLARLFLLRVLPKRILPVVTVVEAVLFLRSIRNRSRTKVNKPAESRTAPPRDAGHASATGAAPDTTP